MTPKETTSRNAPLRFPEWQPEYEAALRESDHKILFKRVEVIEAKLLTRREVVMQDSAAQAELRDIEAALKKLGAIKKDVLKFL
jgi:hypothetical protein